MMIEVVQYVSDPYQSATQCDSATIAWRWHSLNGGLVGITENKRNQLIKLTGLG